MQASDEKLNQLLNSVVAPAARNLDLAQRIISISSEEINASSIESNISEININNEGLFTQILHSFIIPKPAYALACSMMVGILLGWHNSDIAQLVIGINIGSDDGIESALQTTSVEEDLSSLFLAEVNYYE
jgi:hypothetical protein